MSYKKQTKRPKTRKTSIIRRPILTLLFLLLFIGVVFATIKIIQAINQTPENQSEQQISQPNNSPEPQNNSVADNTANATTTEPDKNLSQYSGDDPNNKSSFTGYINYAEKQGDTLRIRVSIDQTINTTGTCKLELKQNDKTVYTAESETETTTATSTCYRAFDVPAADYTGKYQIKITVTADDKSGIIEGEVAL